MYALRRVEDFLRYGPYDPSEDALNGPWMGWINIVWFYYLLFLHLK
jgi:hypothetical protein